MIHLIFLLNNCSTENDHAVRDVVDLTECSSDSDDGGNAMQTEDRRDCFETIKNEEVDFSKGNMYVKW